MTASQSKLALGIIIAGAIIAAAIFYLPIGPESASNPKSDEKMSLSTEYLTVPDGWYLHRLSNTDALLTKNRDLPNIGNTERYAYGEQVGIELIKLDRSPEEWASLQAPDEDPLILSKQWGTSNGYATLRVEQEAAGAAGKQLTRYLFVNDRAYIFSLYPLEIYDSLKKLFVRNEQNVALLEKILSDYAARLQ